MENYGNKKHRIGILIVAYNAATTLVKVLGRIPSNIINEVEEIAVFDDASRDDTYILAQGYKLLNRFSKLRIFKNPKNLGYGGNQKLGYEYFIKKGFDIVVLLHGDGQYAPELLKNIYKPIIDGEADAVFGSRMMKKYGGAIKGGMPLYKYLGNRILTLFENKMLNMRLTEFHSGYRAYNCHALEKVLFQTCSNDFHFDTEIIIKLNHQQFRIIEVPIPTYYGKEICYVSGLKYAYNVVRSVINYKLSIYGLKKIPTYSEFFKSYPLREHTYSSHSLITGFVGEDKAIFDLGCGAGYLSQKLRKFNKFVHCADIEKNDLSQKNCDIFFQIDLEKNNRFDGIDVLKYDAIICADIIEHLKNPDDLLRDLNKKMKPNAKLILSVPNIANIFIRLSLMFGKFSYQDAGILDKSHLKFFTFSTIKKLIVNNNFKIINEKATPIPLALFLPKRFSSNIFFKIFDKVFFKFTNLFKRLLAYQFVFVLIPNKNDYK